MTYIAYMLYIICMKTKVKLTPADREFFAKVSRAAFTNPFSPTRIELDRQIAGAPPAISRDDLVEQVIARIGERLTALHGERKANLELYAGEDRDILRIVFLFDVYHRFRKEFDTFIIRQIEAGDAPCHIPFARDNFSILTGYGFSVEESRRYFAIFYQIRRAFYFIESALIGLAPSMHNLRFQLWNNVFTSDISWYDSHLWNRMEDFSTLLFGETGTGKGAAAAAIGCSGFIPFNEKTGCFSESFTRNFISINLSQYPETLIESELFGHKKGGLHRCHREPCRHLQPLHPARLHLSRRDRRCYCPGADQAPADPPGAHLLAGRQPRPAPLPWPGNRRYQQAAQRASATGGVP